MVIGLNVMMDFLNLNLALAVKVILPRNGLTQPFVLLKRSVMQSR